jgi:hypothetical protein
MLQQGWHLVKIPLLHTHIIWAMYILGLSSSWGTSRICPAWSPFGNQLALALSPIWGPCLKPRHPEEVVYSPKQLLTFHPTSFPSETSSATYIYCFLGHIHIIHTILHSIHTSNYLFYLHNIPLYYFCRSSSQAGCPWSVVSVTGVPIIFFDPESTALCSTVGVRSL